MNELVWISIKSYLSNPCGTLSIPYWKQKNLTLPKNMKVIHEKDFDNDLLNDYNDEPYFRLYHNMQNIDTTIVNEFINESEIISGVTDTDAFVDLINASYDDLSVTKEQLEGYRKRSVYCPDLWILLKKKDSGAVIAGGIADFDKELGELTLEWIQVMPTYRGKGYGKAVVNSLLSKMKGIAHFATVSGKVKSSFNSEGLYRGCGFTGDDVWHILTKKGM